MSLTEKQNALYESSPDDFSGLRGLFFNRTRYRSPGQSHTEGLIGMPAAD